MNQKNDAKQANDVSTNLSDETRSFQDRIDEVRRLVEENLRYSKNLNQLSEMSSTGNQAELYQLVKENLKVTKELRARVEKIDRWILFQRIFGVVKLLLIIIPLILGLIYLPALLQQVAAPYQEFLQLNQPSLPDQSGLIDQLNQYLNNSDEPAQ